jgi:P4 family phage/plasmid primase-like protien
MQTFKILEGKNHDSPYWYSKDITIPEWYDNRFKIPMKMPITMESFAKASKDVRNDLKNVESFVGATSKESDRKLGNITGRTLMTLDLDHCDLTTVGKIKAVLRDTQFILHSTASHSTSQPRYRLIITPNTIIGNEQYEALCRVIMSEIGINYFDTTCVEINRLFYYPAIPEGGLYDVGFNEGKPLVINEWLAKYTNWKDVSEWVYSDRETKVIKRELGKAQQDPTTKGGYIGAFCRVYDIHSTIAVFLNDKYEGGDKSDRYTFIGGSSINGMQIFDDKFAYSYQESDPCSRTLNNSFDLLRKHMFPNEDEKKSVKDMLEFCRSLDDVKSDWITHELESKEAKIEEVKNVKPNGSDNKPYIVENKGRLSIDCPCLSEYIRQHSQYIFCKSDFTVMRYWYKDGVYQLVSDNEIKGFIKSYIPSAIYKSRDVNEVFTDLITDLKYNNFDVLNRDEHLINFKNGLLDINTMELLPHTPDTLSTVQLPCNWNPEAISKNGIWDKYIKTLTDSDSEIEELLLQFLGLSLSNIHGYRVKKSIFMFGKGNTGKSKIKELTYRLLGNNNCSGVDLTTLEARFGASKLFNKRLIGSNDMKYATVAEVNTFKLAIGGDTLDVEFKGLGSFEYIYKGLMWFCCNELPKFGGDKGEWVYERIITIECLNVISIKDQDDELLDKMYADREYIVRLCIEALLRLRKNRLKFKIPEKCKVAKEIYVKDNSSFLTFYNECCVPRNETKDGVTCKTLYDVYTSWCKDNCNGYKEPKLQVNKVLETMGMTKKKINTQRFWREFTLNEETQDDYKYLCTIL